MTDSMSYTPSQLNSMLVDNIEHVCKKLLPNGKRDGSEWRCGDVNGDAGASLGVSLSGSKAGVWCDFATGQAGDLIELWKAVKNLSTAEALKEIREYLNIKDPSWVGKPKKNYSQPPKINGLTTPRDECTEWLMNDRKLSDRAIKAYQLGMVREGDKTYVVFPFKRDGKLFCVKRRDIADKHNCKQVGTNQEKGLFGWQAIDDSHRIAYITEGELDALAMFDYGYPALSVPFGGGGGAKQDWVENEYENLSRFDEIYLCLDDDKEGHAAVLEIVQRIGADRCKVVTFPHKDANECLMQGVSQAEIIAAIKNAKSFDPQELRQWADYYDDVEKMFRPDDGIEPGFDVPWPETRLKMRFRWAELSIINGINGHGKSQAAQQFVLSAIAQGERACIASMELKPARLLKYLTMQAAGMSRGFPSSEYHRAIVNWSQDKLWIFECVGTAKADRLLEVFRYARKRYGIKVFLIDSLMKCGFAEDDYNGIKKFVEKLCDFKNEYDCHVFLVTHARKGKSEEEEIGKFDVKGTGAIVDLADNLINWWRNKKKERFAEKGEMDTETIDAMPDAKMIIDKQRNGDWEGEIKMWFCKNSRQFREHKHSRNIEYVPFSTELRVVK